MLRKLLLICFSLATFGACAEERINVYTRFPANEPTAFVTATLITELNKKLDEKYDFRLGTIPGSGGEAADGKALAEAKLGTNTIVAGTISNFTLNPIIYNSTIDRDADFVPIELIALVPNAIMVSPDLKVDSLDQFVKYVKGKKEAFNGATVQAVSPKLLDAIFRKQYDINNVKMIQYKTPGEITKSVLSGEVDYSVQNPIDTPGLKLLAISLPNRNSQYPNVPTGLELGIKDFNYASSLLLYAPKANAKFIDEIKKSVHEACASDAVRDVIAKLKLVFECNNNEQFLRTEIARQKQLVKKYEDSIKQ